MVLGAGGNSVGSPTAPIKGSGAACGEKQDILTKVQKIHELCFEKGAAPPDGSKQGAEQLVAHGAD